jgi:TolB protein
MLAMLLLAAATAPTPAYITSVRDSYPVLSPDGTTLVFQSNRNGRGALYAAAPDGKDVRLLLDTGDDPSTPTWSPDSRHLAYVANVDGSTEIFVMAADGTQRRQLTSAPGDDEHPHWGADGRIWWDSGRTTPDLSKPWTEHHQEVHSMAADGSDVRQHTRCRSLCTFASLSPDQRRLAYRRVLATPGVSWDQSASPRNSEVMIANLDGSQERNLSQHAAFDGWPVWAPDSRWVVFASNREGVPNRGQVFAVRVDGSGLHALTGGQWSNVQPSVSTDGTRLYTYQHREAADSEHGFVAATAIALPDDTVHEPSPAAGRGD